MAGGDIIDINLSQARIVARYTVRCAEELYLSAGVSCKFSWEEPKALALSSEEGLNSEHLPVGTTKSGSTLTEGLLSFSLSAFSFSTEKSKLACMRVTLLSKYHRY